MQKEVKHIADIRFGNVGNLETLYEMLLEKLERKQVYHVLHVLYAVYMTVHVDVAVTTAVSEHGLGICHLHSAGRVDGTLLLGYNIINNASAVQNEQVFGLSGVERYHRPNALGIAIHLSAIALDGEITVGEEPEHLFNPRFYRVVFVLAGHLVHLDYETGEHPCVLALVKRGNAEAAVVGMEACGVEQVVAKHAHEQFAVEVDLKGFGNVWCTTYVIHLSLFRSHIFLFAFRKIFGKVLYATLCDGNSARAHILEHASAVSQRMIERLDIFGKTVLCDDAVRWIHLYNVGIVDADVPANLRILQHHGSRNLYQSALFDENLVVGEIVCLKNINFLFNLTRNLVNRLLVAVACDGVLVYALYARSRNVKALDVYLSASEHGCNLVQQSGKVLREDKNCI